MTTDLKSLRTIPMQASARQPQGPKFELSEGSKEVIKLLKFSGITALVIIAGLIAMAVVVSIPSASRAVFRAADWYNGIDFLSLLVGLLVFVGAIGWYFTPAMVAMNRHRPDVLSIFIVNLFFGWTVIGWVLTLAWAALPVARKLK